MERKDEGKEKWGELVFATLETGASRLDMESPFSTGAGFSAASPRASAQKLTCVPQQVKN